MVKRLEPGVTHGYHWRRAKHHSDHLRPSSLGAEDSFIWLPSFSGDYSTKSGYFSLVKRRNDQNIPRSQNRSFDWIQNLWGKAVYPKIKIFLWKILQKALPLGENLQNRGFTSNTNCVFCEQIETAEHLFLNCRFAQRVWQEAPFKAIPRHTLSTTFEEALTISATLIPLPPTGVVTGMLFPWICWSLWKARNLQIFQNRITSSTEVLTCATRDAAEWERVQVSIPPSRSAGPNFIGNQAIQTDILFTDAAWNNTNNCAGLGWYIKSAEGSVISQGGSATSHVNSPVMAEAIGILKGLSTAKELQLQSIRVRSDSAQLINAINGQIELRKLHGLIADIKLTARSFKAIDFTHVPRSENLIADSLAKESLLSNSENLDLCINVRSL